MPRLGILLMLFMAVKTWAGVPSGLLMYKVWETGLEPYISRILVTPRHVRMDEGQDQGGFTLYDREQGIIYSVSAEDESVLVLRPPGDLPGPVAGLKLSEKIEADEGAPPVAGKQPEQLQLYTNGELCRELVTVQGVMSHAVAGLAEFRRALARYRRSTETAAARSPCDQSEFLYASDRSLDFGLPIHDSYAGKRQVLLDFNQQYDAAPGLFAVPASYREVTIPGLPTE